MARPRGFDEQAVLERATGVFWTKGFEQTSLDDLCEATGLNRSSLYAAFGDKRQLYLRTLERYAEEGTQRVAAALGRPPLRNSFGEFVGRLIEDIVAGPGRRGCFIGNCAAELARLDRGAGVRVRASLERIEATFHEALEAARARGELRRDVDTEALARFLTAGVQGLRLVGKAKPDRAALEDIARVMLSCLDSQGG
jgi:TetR/AcrR family transcriptional repressor of nem operon